MPRLIKKTIEVKGYLQEIDLIWSVLGTGQASTPEGSVDIVGSPMPTVDIVSDTTIRLTLSAGAAYLTRDGITVKTTEITIADGRLQPLLTTKRIQLFDTAFGAFVLQFRGDMRPVFRRYKGTFAISWPNGTATIDIPWWPVDPEISVIDVYSDRRVDITTKRGNLITLEFV